MGSQESMLFKEAFEEIKKKSKMPKSKQPVVNRIARDAKTLYGPLVNSKNQIRFKRKSQTQIEGTKR